MLKKSKKEPVEQRLRKFCPSCGKNTEDLFEGLCKDCFLKNTELVHGRKRIEFGICYDCARARFNKFWREYPNMNAIIQDVVARNISPRHGVTIDVHYPQFTIKGKTEVPLDIEAALVLDGKKLAKKYEYTIVIFPEICPECSRMRGGYFEAIMQLRGERKDDMQKYVEKNIKTMQKRFPNAFITKIETLKEGTDIYLGSKDAARKFGSDLRKLYNVRCLITKKIHGMKQGKEICRWTVLLDSNLNPSAGKNPREQPGEGDNNEDEIVS